MWCRWRTITAITFGVTASLVSYEFALAQNRSYTPSEFRAVMRGLGYNVPESGALTDAATQQAIRSFQQRYNLQPDGLAGKNTQDVAANLIKNLQGSLNIVVKPNPPLPRNQFYTPETTAAVQQFQKQVNLPVNGVASLEVRSRLDQEAKRILGKETPSPTTTPSPIPTETPSPIPTETPSPTPTLSPTETPSPTPTPLPTETPSPTPTLSPTETPSPTP